MQSIGLRVGVGIDTGRYGHHATFLRPDRQPAAPALQFTESAEGYDELLEVLRRLQSEHVNCQVHVHLDAAGQYATNLLQFLQSIPKLTVSVGEPKRNKDYHAAVSPKRKSDTTESNAMARFAIAEAPAPMANVSAEVILLREVTSRLKVKTGDVTRAKNRLHKLLAQVFPEFAQLVSDIASSWVLTLLDKYPTPGKIWRGHLCSMLKIPYVIEERMVTIHKTARTSIGNLTGEFAESLVRLAVAELKEAIAQRKRLEKLLEQVYAELPASGHVQLTTIPGIGTATAAVLISKIVDIERFSNAEKVVGYFGVFPRELQSGVDKAGQPKPSKTHRMSQQGNDLARSYLYNAATAAIRCNPAIRSLYKRLRARGKNHNVAMGHCMRKLLHLVFAIWTTDKPFDPNHHPWEPTSENTVDSSDATKNAAGHSRNKSSTRLVVTATDDIVDRLSDPVNQRSARASRTSDNYVDFQHIRSQVTMQQVVEQLDLARTLYVSGGELRGPCPIHGGTDKRRRDFSVNFDKQVFCCFNPDCNAKGNQLDLWAQVNQQTIHEAATSLITTFNLNQLGTEKRSP